MTSALDWGWVVNATPRPLYPRERDPVPTLQEARCAGLDGCGKSRPPLGFNPSTVQPVASRYTNRAITSAQNTHHVVRNYCGFSVIFLCCCFRFRIPRTKQEIEADYLRKKLTKKFQKHLRVIQNSEMDNMDLKRGTVQSCSDFGSRACVISTVGQEAHLLETQNHRELMMMR